MKPLLLLLLINVVGLNAFTYTCNEVKKVIRENTVIHAKHACVAFDENISLNSGFPKQVYLTDANGNLQYSLADLAQNCVDAASSKWRIVDQNGKGNDIDCSNEFTLLFSSTLSFSITATRTIQSFEFYNKSKITLVAPSGGILIDFSCAKAEQPLYFYTGLGEGASEEMFYYGSSLCDERLSIYAWDTAVTISVPLFGNVVITYSATAYPSLGSMSYDVLLMGSGKSSNLVQHRKEEKSIKLTPIISGYHKFQIDGFAEFDRKYGNSLAFSTQCTTNNCSPSKLQSTNGNVKYLLDGDILTVKYNTKVDDDQFKDDDLFFMRIATTPLSETEVPPTVPLPKPNTDYSCGCDLAKGRAEFISDLWLDIVFVVDVSRNMGNKLYTASSMIDSIVSSLTLESSGKKQYSRVGLVTVTSDGLSDAQILYNFTTPFPSKLTLTMGERYSAYISSAGVGKALQIFDTSTPRGARQVIFVIASVDSSSFINHDVPAFKDKGGLIMAVDLDPVFISLIDLSNAGYYTTILDKDVDAQFLCEANCFCPSDFTPFSTEEENRQTADRGCYRAYPSKASFDLAKEICQEKEALLTTIHDDAMQQFVLTMATEGIGAREPYWIGYEYNGTSFEWNDDSSSSYSKWASNQPDLNAGRCVYSQQTTGFNSGWFTDDCSIDNSFVCGRPPCTVKNFCDGK